MQLIGMLDSPFVRRVAVTMRFLDIDYEHRPLSVLRGFDEFRRVNPLVKVPTLVLCGRDDLLCPVERHELMRDLVPGSRLVVIEDAAHLPTLEAPDETNEALKNWLEA